MQTREPHRRSARRGGVSIAVGAAIAAAGAVTLAIGLHASGDPMALASGSPTIGGSGSAASWSSAGQSVRRSSATVNHESPLPQPTGHSSPAPIANPVGVACIPKSLTVSGVDITRERVVAMGTNAQGQIYPPAHTTMWYDKSAQPGQDGISVIAGHVTYDGPDNFYNLRDVRVGTRVTVTCAGGKVVSLKVTDMASVPKNELTTDQRVWGGSATPVVTLVTCDIKSPMINGHHLNNFVVWTEPA